MVGDRELLTLGVDLDETRLETALVDASGSVLAVNSHSFV
jgi:predicted NBD/HSP70 family sugar kinase